MDLLGTAVIDITTLVATCHALKLPPVADTPAAGRKLSRALRLDLRRATAAYIDTLARSKQGTFDDALLSTCRAAAEREMGLALQHQELLRQMMLTLPGALEGTTAMRQDLWRLAHMTIHLRGGIVTLLACGDGPDTQRAAAIGARLRRRLRKALVAYARTSLRNKSRQKPMIVSARLAAMAKIGGRGATEAEQLADIEASRDIAGTPICQGVAKPLCDLAHDWQSSPSAALHAP